MDTFGWLERLLDGPKAARYNRVFARQGPEDIVTSVVTVCEVDRRLKPLQGESAALEAIVYPRATRLIPVDVQPAPEAADCSLTY